MANNPNVIINVCASVSDKACPKDSAVCSLEDGLSWGSFRDHTLAAKADGTSTLKYTQGDYCPHNRNVRYSTTINFKCSHAVSTVHRLFGSVSSQGCCAAGGKPEGDK